MQLSTQEVQILVNEVRSTLEHAATLREKLLFMMQEEILRGNACPACGGEWIDGALDHEHMCDYLVLLDMLEDS